MDAPVVCPNCRRVLRTGWDLREGPYGVMHCGCYYRPRGGEVHTDDWHGALEATTWELRQAIPPPPDSMRIYDRRATRTREWYLGEELVMYLGENMIPYMREAFFGTYPDK